MSDPPGIAFMSAPNSRYRGEPDGCETPEVAMAAASSPLSTKVTTGASVSRYRVRAATNNPNAASPTIRCTRVTGTSPRGDVAGFARLPDILAGLVDVADVILDAHNCKAMVKIHRIFK